MTSRSNCCVPGCNSVYKNNPELTFHHFPNDGQKVVYVNEFGRQSNVDRKKIWEMKLRMGKRITKHMRVCSKHFVDEDFVTPGDWGYKKRYLKKTAVPSKYLPASSIITSYKQEGKNRRLERLMKRREITNVSNMSDMQQKEEEFNENHAAEVLLELNTAKQEFAINEKFVKEFSDACTQTDNNNKELKDAEIQVDTSWSTISDFIQTEKALIVLTGISSFSVLSLLLTLYHKYKKNSRCQTLSLKSRIFLVFLKLKLDLTYSALGVLFGGISVPTCKKIFQSTVEILSDILANFVFLPSKEEVLRNMPLCFEKYRNVRIVLDCTEIKVQIPRKLCCRIKLYSHYKKSHTLKFMTAVTPAGLIAYASPSYGGRASDKSIFEQSRIIEKLIPYTDAIMVDKGFLVETFCENYGIKLVRPPFLRKKKQFNKEEASSNRRIASARVHIERVNARIKVFKIFRNTFPLHLVPIVDDLFLMICGIVNLSSPILKDNRFFQ